MMAITQGAGPHLAWLTIDGSNFPIEHGNVTQSAQRKTAQFHCVIPMAYPGAEETFATIGDHAAVVTVQTRGVTAPLVTGSALAADFDYIGGKINVTGHDKSSKLHNNKTSEKWLNKKPSEIVQDLIGRVGLSGDVTASTIEAGKRLEQDFVKLSDNVSFAYVIHKMAELDGARWWVDPSGTFHYQPYGNRSGSYTIFIDRDSTPIRSDCIQLRVRRNMQASKDIAVTIKSWHPKKKQVFSWTSNVEGSGGPVNYSYHIPTLELEHVQKHARSQATEKARHEFTVSATVVGDPTVAAGMGLSLSGTRFFDQSFDIDTVHHDFGMSGHRTHITARSAKEGRIAS